MGLGGINMWQLLIILVIVVLIFGTKRLKSLGGDLGGAVKSFRSAMDSKDEEAAAAERDAAEKDEAERKRLESGGEPDAEFAEQKEFTEQKEKQQHG